MSIDKILLYPPLLIFVNTSLIQLLWNPWIIILLWNPGSNGDWSKLSKFPGVRKYGCDSESLKYRNVTWFIILVLVFVWKCARLLNCYPPCKNQKRYFSVLDFGNDLWIKWDRRQIVNQWCEDNNDWYYRWNKIWITVLLHIVLV